MTDRTVASDTESNWEELQPGKAHRAWWSVTITHLRGHSLGERNGRFIEGAQQALDRRPFLARAVALSSLLEVVFVSDEGVAQRVRLPANWPSGSRFRLARAPGFCHKVPRASSSHCSHRLRTSLEERLFSSAFHCGQGGGQVWKATGGPSRPW